MNRTSEFVLGLIGGILGACLAILMIFGAYISSTLVDFEQFSAINSNIILIEGILLLLLSGASILYSMPSRIQKNHVLSGVIHLITGILGFCLTFILWLLPGILLIISGALCLRKSRTKTIGDVASSTTPPKEPPSQT